MASSTDRVIAAAAAAKLNISISTMPASTRTAEEAAAACNCDVGQIVKSLVFEGKESGSLQLILVSGRNRVDMKLAQAAVGEMLARADPKRVRDETGFAIGGVAPIGHKTGLPCWIDETLLRYDSVWAAAGAPNAVFCVDPRVLKNATGAIAIRLA